MQKLSARFVEVAFGERIPVQGDKFRRIFAQASETELFGDLEEVDAIIHSYKTNQCLLALLDERCEMEFGCVADSFWNKKGGLDFSLQI